MVVEIVVKLMEKMGYLVEREEEEGGVFGVVVVVVVKMEKEMKERKVEKLVVEEREKVAGHGKHHGCVPWAVRWPAGWKRKEERK